MAAKKKKLDVKGRSSGGAEHKHRKRASTQSKHQRGKARKQRDYGGEKGDESRRLPRKQPRGWKGPWPPREAEAPSPAAEEIETTESGASENLNGE